MEELSTCSKINITLKTKYLYSQNIWNLKMNSLKLRLSELGRYKYGYLGNSS